MCCFVIYREIDKYVVSKFIDLTWQKFVAEVYIDIDIDTKFALHTWPNRGGRIDDLCQSGHISSSALFGRISDCKVASRGARRVPANVRVTKWSSRGPWDRRGV